MDLCSVSSSLACQLHLLAYESAPHLPRQLLHHCFVSVLPCSSATGSPESFSRKPPSLLVSLVLITQIATANVQKPTISNLGRLQFYLFYFTSHFARQKKKTQSLAQNLSTSQLRSQLSFHSSLNSSLPEERLIANLIFHSFML